MWVHHDDLTELVLNVDADGDGVPDRLVTTEDHPFWNATDQTWEGPQDFAPGDEVIDDQWNRIEVTGLDPGTTHRDLAYNLTVEDIHTYHVGTADILVHNTGDACDLPEYRGGKHKDLETGNGLERNHMPADSVSPLTKGQGPAIQMDVADHYQTASWGSSKVAKAHRAKQKDLIDAGRFDDVIQMDFDDITSLFPGKYDAAILEMIDTL